MSKEHEFEMAAHPSIYSGADRKLKVYFAEPENGVNEQTGICLLIAGYGGNTQSNVYKKMRDQFADKYNLVVVQCDYFGNEFMQNPTELNSNGQFLDFFTSIASDSEKMKINSGEFVLIEFQRRFPETLDNFNDMSIMQTIDNLTAVMAVVEIMKDNGLTFNAKRIIAYGHSHGAYLALMANVYAPGLFALVIDNSAYLLPNYINKSRKLSGKLVNLAGAIHLNYKAERENWVDRGLIDLNTLYETPSSCKIVTFQGVDDDLIGYQEKRLFSHKINSEFHLISQNEVDGEMIKSTKHGLDADFLLMFDFVMGVQNLKFGKGSDVVIPDVEIKTNDFTYQINYENKIPIVTRN